MILESCIDSVELFYNGQLAVSVILESTPPGEDEINQVEVKEKLDIFMTANILFNNFTNSLYIKGIIE